MLMKKIKTLYSHKFKTLSDADQAVDLLNNVIGREIGKTTSIDSTSKDIAKKSIRLLLYKWIKYCEGN